MKRLFLIPLFLASCAAPGKVVVSGHTEEFEGYRTVINVRHPSETPEFDERTEVEALGIRYYNRPFKGTKEMTDELVDELRELLRTSPRPILFHCRSGNRVGAIWFAYRVLDEGADPDAAEKEAIELGLKPEKYGKAIKEYIKRRQ